VIALFLMRGHVSGVVASGKRQRRDHKVTLERWVSVCGVSEAHAGRLLEN
jgi:hypothetical protein